MSPKRRFFFKQPAKNETLVGRIEEKNHRRFSSRFSQITPEWWVGVGEAGGLLFLFLLSLFLLYHFFGQEDTFNVFSAPLVPVLADLTSVFAPYSFGVRIWLLSFLLAFPLTFYFFIKELSGRKLVAFLSSLLSLLPLGFFLPSRVKMGLLGEDGAHVASLTMVPIVCLLLLRFLRRGGFKSGVLAALGFTLVALTSPLGLFTLFCFALVVAFSEVLLGEGRLKILRFLTILFLVMGFSAFWYNPKFVILTLASPQGVLVKQTLFRLLPISFFLVPLLGTFGYLLFEQRSHLQPAFLAIFWTIGFGLLALGAGVPVSAPSRFLSGFGISLAFLLALLMVALFDFIRFSPRLKGFRISQRKRQLLGLAFMALITGVIFLVVFWKSGSVHPERALVLGAISPEQTVGLWEIREKTSRLETVLGYSITALTGLGVAVLRMKLGGF